VVADDEEDGTVGLAIRSARIHEREREETVSGRGDRRALRAFPNKPMLTWKTVSKRSVLAP
jgi:hypothetical protein